MDEALQVAIELNEYTWNGFKKDLEDVTAAEVNWRPCPEANTINLIVRHLRIDTPWHVRNVGENSLGQDADTMNQTPESVPLDFERNLREFDELYTRVHCRATSDDARQRGAAKRSRIPGRGAGFSAQPLSRLPLGGPSRKTLGTSPHASQSIP